MLEITAMVGIFFDDVKSYNTIKDLLLYNNMLDYTLHYISRKEGVGRTLTLQ
jgi:hypothetical protein